MYRTEIYSEEEYIDYLNRNPQHNLLLSCTGVDNIAVHDAERHLRWIKGQNEELYKQNAAEKKKQSDRAREQNEAKRKAEQTGAYGQGPSKKGTVKPVARNIHRRGSFIINVCKSVDQPPSAKSVPTMIAVTLENGRSGTGAGTRKSSGMAELSGKRDKL